jgi:hypothetical protein
MIHVAPTRLPGQHEFHGREFPLALACRTSGAALAEATAWVAQERGALDRQAGEHGAVLLRGFGLATAEDFDAFIAAFGYRNFPYEESLSNAVRVVKTPRVFTANEAPPDVAIFLHHEMAQTPVYPAKLLFFCEQPAAEGGATPICRSDVLFERLREAAPQFARDCEEKGLKYTNVMPPAADLASGMGRSWQSTLRAETRAQAEARLAGLGYDWEWQADGSLAATTPLLPAVRDLPGGRKSFFNQLIAAHQGWKDTRNDPSRAIRHGDGSRLDPQGVLAAVELAEQVTFDIPWQAGDVALVDNYVTMHGRRRFRGTRKVLASLVADG